jgi:hypothetical protein
MLSVIPKKIHIIWIGKNENWFTANVETFRAFNPGWEVRLWTDENIPRLYNQKIYDKIPVQTTKADLLRLELLYRHGGVYVDIDSICLKPLDKMIEGRKAFFSSHRRSKKKFEINCIGSIPGHPTIGRLITGFPDYWGRLTKIKTEDTKKAKGISVYCVYTYIRCKLAHENVDIIPRVWNCTMEEATDETFIIQQNVHTFSEYVNKKNKFTMEGQL